MEQALSATLADVRQRLAVGKTASPTVPVVTRLPGRVEGLTRS